MTTPQETAINGAFSFARGSAFCRFIAVLLLAYCVYTQYSAQQERVKKEPHLQNLANGVAQINGWSRETANELVAIKNQLTIMNNDAMNAAKREDRIVALLERINDNLARTVSGLERRSSPLALHNEPRGDIMIKTNYEK